MKLALTNGILTADLYGSPTVESKSQKTRTWKEDHKISPINNTSTQVALVFHHQSDLKCLQTNLERIPSLSSAFHTGLCNNYPNFDPTDSDIPYDRLPLVRDPTLVRAAQLAILKLRDIDNDINENAILDTQESSLQDIVEVFGGIKNRFHDRSKYRLLKTCQKSRQNQHEE